MNDKLFNSILAKNELARCLSSIYQQVKKSKDRELVALVMSDCGLAISQLKEIEKYIGEANQPSVEDVYLG